MVDRRTHPLLPGPATPRIAVWVAVWAAVWVAASLAGCASSSRSPAALAGARVQRVAVAPMNIVLALPAELESSAGSVQTALVEYLSFHGKAVVEIDYRTGRSLWRESMQEVIRTKKPQSFESAARVYVGRLRAHGEFDALVIPSIFLQNVETRTSATLARWDGARERVRIERHVPGATTCEQGYRTKAASILVKVFDAEGELLHSAQSGLELVEHIEVRSNEEKGGGWRTCEWVTNTPALDDPERIMEGIARGLDPFLPERIPEPHEIGAESRESRNAD